MLERLPERSPQGLFSAARQTMLPLAVEEITRIDHYLNHLKNTRTYLPPQLRYLAVDGFYSKQKFVDGVVNLDLEVVGKLRNANLRYLYSGQQKLRGAKRKYDGKVVLSDLTRLTHVQELAPNLNLYTAIVWHVSLKRQISLACLVNCHKSGKTSYVLLFSTDIELKAELILSYYKARFQIEFLFRDGKQFTGLSDAQTRDPKRLDFHFNASLTALNLAKYEDHRRYPIADSSGKPIPFSMSSYKRVAFNDYLLERFISQLALNPTLIKSHPNYESVRTHGIIAS